MCIRDSTVDEMTEVLLDTVCYTRTVGPERLLVELLKLDHPHVIRLFTALLGTCGEWKTPNISARMLS